VTPLLEVEGLRKSFALTGPKTWAARLRGERPAVRAVDGVSFAIAKGETLGLVGESGCGKSTVARCLLRVIEPTTGSIRFAGEEITALDGRQLRNTRRAMQMVYQDPTAALNPRVNARRTIEEPLRLHFKMTPAERRERLNAVIAEVGLRTNLVERYPHELSDGQRQRVNIARAIAAASESRRPRRADLGFGRLAALAHHPSSRGAPETAWAFLSLYLARHCHR
jgi:ABC-type oligopeptide transport system ATPase subunit